MTVKHHLQHIADRVIFNDSPTAALMEAAIDHEKIVIVRIPMDTPKERVDEIKKLSSYNLVLMSDIPMTSHLSKEDFKDMVLKMIDEAGYQDWINSRLKK